MSVYECASDMTLYDSDLNDVLQDDHRGVPAFSNRRLLAVLWWKCSDIDHKRFACQREDPHRLLCGQVGLTENGTAGVLSGDGRSENMNITR